MMWLIVLLIARQLQLHYKLCLTSIKMYDTIIGESYKEAKYDR